MEFHPKLTWRMKNNFFEEAHHYTKHSLFQCSSKTFAFLTWHISTHTQTLGVPTDFNRH